MIDSLFSYLFPLKHADLIRQLAVREVVSRYRQSWLGMLWTLVTPLLMLATFTFVFRIVFKMKWGTSGAESDLAFALRLYAGLAVFNFFSECVTRAPRLILDQPHLVKKVIFPIEILSWVNALAALTQLAVALGLLLVLSTWEFGRLPITAWALPLVWLPLLPLCVGLGWLLSSVGTYVRDVGQLVLLAVNLLMFLSPIFFPLSSLPDAIRFWVGFNPLTLPITLTHTVLLDGQWPNWSAWAVHLLCCVALAWLGAAFFRAARKGFADVV